MSNAVRLPLTNNAADIILKKIKQMQTANECLKLDRQMHTKRMQIYKIHSDVSKAKLDLSNKIIALYTEQISEFTAARERQIHELFAEFNLYDEPTEEFKELCKELDEMNARMDSLSEQVERMSASLPESTEITQTYEVVGGQCSTATVTLD